MLTNPLNLFESLILDGLNRAMKIVKSKKRQTENLDPLGTLGLFQATRNLKNEDLVLLFTEFGEDDVFEKSEHNVKARRLRSGTMVRSSKFRTLNEQAVKLLTVSSLSKGEIVKGWVFALILEATRQTISETKAAGNIDDLDQCIESTSSTSDPLILTSIERIEWAIQEKFEKSGAGVISNSNVDTFLANTEFKPNPEKRRTAAQEKERALQKARDYALEAEIRRWLPAAGDIMIAEMRLNLSNEECLLHLKKNVLPCLDEYPFGEDAETNRKFLGDFPLRATTGSAGNL